MSKNDGLNMEKKKRERGKVKEQNCIFSCLKYRMIYFIFHYEWPVHCCIYMTIEANIFSFFFQKKIKI